LCRSYRRLLRRDGSGLARAGEHAERVLISIERFKGILAARQDEASASLAVINGQKLWGWCWRLRSAIASGLQVNFLLSRSPETAPRFSFLGSIERPQRPLNLLDLRFRLRIGIADRLRLQPLAPLKQLAPLLKLSGHCISQEYVRGPRADFGGVAQPRERVDQLIDLMIEKADIAAPEGNGFEPRNLRTRHERIGAIAKDVSLVKFAVAAA
jgi:hypothetical protein